MRIYLDTSAATKLVVVEEETEALLSYLKADGRLRAAAELVGLATLAPS